ncbi:MAG: CPBP family intramembrane metalloprotease [Bacteroidaceae bacterium]|nr:CPBP family intramembrane metalloprotease [Bacteroidaceae bacterium]
MASVTTRLSIAVATAIVLWFLMFSPWTAHFFNFWWAMTASAVILTSIAFIFGGNPLQVGSYVQKPNVRTIASELSLGVVVAVVLWGIFWTGDKLSQALFDFARPQVDLIYTMKDGESACLIATLLLCIIGPAEELFWRGYIQRTLAIRHSPLYAFILTTLIYTIVHLPSGNFMLIMAAMTCGFLWGGLYYLMPRHLPAIVISHALWDAAAFVWFPF